MTPTVGVLALQGAFAAHLAILRELGVDAVAVKTREQLAAVDALVMPGGESTTMSMLLVKGDMLFLSDSGSMQRVHGAFVTEDEVAELVRQLRDQGAPQFDETLIRMKEESESKEAEADEDTDENYDRAVAIVAETRNASISYIQRRLKVGYNRAARMVEQMENEGVIGPQIGNKPREVFISAIEDE